MIERTNSALEGIVRTGIALDREAGSVRAWAYMSENGADDNLILRVLVAPSQRRKTDYQTVHTPHMSEKHFLDAERLGCVTSSVSS